MSVRSVILCTLFLGKPLRGRLPVLSAHPSLLNDGRIHFYAPNFEKVGTYWFRLVRMYVCMCVCIHVRDIVLKLHVCIPHGKIADAYFWFSLNYLPLSNYGPLLNKGMKFGKCRISKSIIARNLKLVSADRG